MESWRLVEKFTLFGRYIELTLFGEMLEINNHKFEVRSIEGEIRNEVNEIDQSIQRYYDDNVLNDNER